MATSVETLLPMKVNWDMDVGYQEEAYYPRSALLLLELGDL